MLRIYIVICLGKNINILLDTCIYLRLAIHLHPLLGTPFGRHNYRCFLHKDFMNEYTYNERLEKKFGWVNDKDYVDNRKKRIQLNKEQKNKIDTIYDFLHTKRKEENLSTRYYDLECLATAYALKMSIATDDYGLKKLSNTVKVRKYTSIQILNLMRAHNHIDNDNIAKIIKHWNQIDDEPANCKNDVRKILKMDYKKILRS